MTAAMVIGIALMLALALAFVLPPLLRRPHANGVDRNALNVELHRVRLAELEADLAAGTLSAAQFDQARQDLERDLLGEVGDDAQSVAAPQRTRGVALVLAGLLPLLALGLYYRLGAWESLDSTFVTAHPDMPAQAGAQTSLPPVDEMVQKLEERLQREPGDQAGWMMLGRTYLFVERYGDAVQAYAQAMALTDAPAAGLLADYAEAMAMVNGGSLAGAPAALLARALEQEPQNGKALWLSGMAAYQTGDFASALARWQPLLNMTEAGSENARIVQVYVEQAQAQLGGAAPELEPAVPAAADTGGRIEVSVDIDPALRERAAPDDTVFVFARAESGPPMPLAIVRTTVSALPGSFVLDDSQAMMPTMKLSSFPRVIVGARISKAGNAMPASGDLQGLSAAVDSAAPGKLSISIDEVVP
jgi:cytochrome c-type biogenesis protein CcmH